MIQVLPAIIPQSKKQLEEEIKKVAYFAKLIQVDISDGIFTETTTWPYNGRDADFFQSLKHEETGWPHWQDIDIELHMMVMQPEKVLLDWIMTGISGVVAHIEATDDFQKVIALCRTHSISVGAAFRPSIDIVRLEPFISQVDFIQCMGSDRLGRHGVPLEKKAITLIKRLREMYPKAIIAIDIGVNEDTAEMLVKAGANKLISGGAILKADNPEKVFKYFESLG